MLRRLPLVAAWTVSILLVPSVARAQASDTFVQGVVALANAVDGAEGGEGPAILAALDTMAAGLAQWDAAIANVESGLAAEVGTAPPAVAARMRTALGAAYLERGRVEAALAQFDTASELDPGFADVHGLRALALEMAGQPGAVAPAYRAAWQRAPERPANAYLFLRSLSAEAGSADRAPATRALASAVDPRVPASAEPLVSFLVIGLLEEASLSVPMFPPAAYAEAFAFLRRAKYDDGLARLKQAAAADPLVKDGALRSPEVRDAITALRRGDASGAVAGLTAPAARGASSEVHRLLGLGYWAASQYQNSLEHFRAAVRLNARDERARLAIGDVLVAAGDLPAAREALHETTQAIPDSGRAHWKLGRLHQTMGDERSALRSFEAAAALVPFAGASHLEAAVGRLYHNQLDLDAAAAAYERRVQAAPNDSAAHLDLAEIYRAQDRLDPALREFLVSALLDPPGAQAFAMAGLVHAAAGRDEEAARMLQAAIARDSNHLEARYGLGRALIRLGRTAEAREQLQIFEQLQARAMEEERLRFEANRRKIQEVLKSGKETAR